jgi:molybdate/tungstate transport system permease protein
VSPAVAAPKRISAFTWVLVFAPFFAVFLLLRMFAAAGLIAAIGAAAWWISREWKQQRRDTALVVFSVIGCLLVFFVILPIVDLLFTTPMSGVVKMARDPSVDAALWMTLSTAGLATAIALCFGVPLGYVLAREQFPGKAIVEGIVDMPVVIPHTIAGIALLFIFGRAGVLGAPIDRSLHVLIADTYWGIVIAMLFVSVPFVVNLSRDGFMGVDPRMENVARSLGATRMGAFFRVTLPLAWRALLSGAIMTWARAISEFGSVAVIAYYPKTINTLLFEWYNFFGYTYTKPLAALLLMVALAIFVLLRFFARFKRTQHDPA